VSTRPEDRNATRRSQAFPDGASLADLEQFISTLTARAAPLHPADLHPRVSVNDDNEVIFMTCAVERWT
jgi:hypothetical protein